MKLNIGLKSALLALGVLIAMPVGTAQAAQASAPAAAVSFIAQHQAKFVIGAIAYILHTRLHTKDTKDLKYSMDDLKGDFEELLNSLNIFDSKLYEQLVFLFDKYIIGVPLKFKDATVKPPKPDKDGNMISWKDKKLKQAPFGLCGLFDAYVLQQAKKLTESIGSAAFFYMYFLHPEGLWLGQLDKAKKDFIIKVSVSKPDSKRLQPQPASA